MIKRHEYMNGLYTHEEYYGQFVDKLVIDTVIRGIGLQRILESKDPSFNDIPLSEWDRLHSWIIHAANLQALKSAGDVNANSLGNSVCIAKTVARQIREIYATKI